MKPRAIAELISDGKLIIGDGYRAKNEELSTDGLPFARAQNINDGFKFEGADRFPVKQLARVGNKVSQPGDVVFTSKGTVGRFALVQPDTPRFVYSPQLCFWRSLDPETIDPRWLFYWMQGREFYEQYKGVAGQTDMADYVSLRDQRAMSISLPQVEKQRPAAEALSALDDKIELNRRLCETLEAIAQALFQSWFVDFDPVRAKASGEAPESICQRLGLTPELLALFPERLADSELGELPEGWSWSDIGSQVKVLGGGTPSTKNPAYWNEGSIYWATPKDLSGNTSKVILGTDRKITDAGLSSITSELLPRGTVLLSSRAPVGYLAITKTPMAINQGFIAMKCDGLLTPEFVLHWAMSSMPEIQQRASGTTFQEISKKNFRTIPVLVPDDAVVNAFALCAKPIYDKIAETVAENTSLEETRDSLLPKLLSGEITIDEGRDG